MMTIILAPNIWERPIEQYIKSMLYHVISNIIATNNCTPLRLCYNVHKVMRVVRIGKVQTVLTIDGSVNSVAKKAGSGQIGGP